MNKMYLVIGDWSDDGHGKFDKVLIETNKKVEEIQNAYKESVKLTDVSFNTNESQIKGMEKATHHPYVDYEDNVLNDEVVEIFKQHNCPSEILEDLDEEGTEINFTHLWFWFIKLSLPDVEYNIVKDEIPNINGYWDKNLNASFGYGLYWG